MWDAGSSRFTTRSELSDAVDFVVYGHHWGDNTGTDFTSLDPTPYLGDPMSCSRFTTTIPSRLPGRLSWLLDGRFPI